ncbi:sulfatase family protein [Phycisphaera mikurensis]|uniref:Putative sulfatase n=1 Tax=Phycisphaera mikurensis (strain NBRC 102666 / KCTC 22515 / FYK2301M01) TaxID=1142394 RepID=I0IFB9_PHYMF|nr:sulfatase [Phycisphaera mikurensis]MBB6440650.1 N-sulfoglucosamine sulfohydrolase [Phycisphaera mikurensis]BAM03957.1 putative sulfatase [Phycisphaera mikurensis NBRC 102666]
MRALRTRSSLRGGFFAGLAIVLLALAEGAAADDAPPHVLFLLTEDHGSHLGFVGTAGVETPHMDRLAARGVYFERAYVNDPVCSPSKANLYTGTYAHTNGLVANTRDFFVPAEKLSPAQRFEPIYRRVRIRDHLPTLVEILDAAGYFTAASGKLHVAPNEKFPYDMMFRENTPARALAVIEAAAAAKKPWFFLANLSAPHRPFRNSEEVAIGVDPAAVELPAFLPDTPTIRRDFAEYLDSVEVADRQVGEILGAVAEAGVLENTLVLLMGDHGPAYHRGKMSLYPFGLHVPLAFAGPGVAEGRRTRELVSGVDVLPTLLELLGLPVPPTVQGRSAAPLVRGEAGATGAEAVFAEIIHGGQSRDDGMQERSVFDGRWKLIYRENADRPRDVNADLKFWALELPDGRVQPWHNRVYREIVARAAAFPDEHRMLAEIDPQSFGVTPPTFELYDTEADPGELENLADLPDHAGTLTRLKRTLAGWLRDTADPFTTREALIRDPAAG